MKVKIFKAYVKTTLPTLSGIIKKPLVIKEELNFLIKKEEDLTHLIQKYDSPDLQVRIDLHMNFV